MEHTPAPAGTVTRPPRPRVPRPRLTGRALIVGTSLAAIVVVLGAACGSSGRDLPPPIPGAVSPTRSTEAVNATGPFALSSPAFTDGGAIPAAYSCQGPSPELTWSGARPVGTTELALVMTDTTNGGFVHWFVAGIGSAESTSPSGGTPPNVAQLPNSAGTAGYTGPCPPAGETHTYQFEILALGSPAALPLETPGKDAYAAIQSKVVGRAVLTGTFTREAAGATTTTAAAPASTTTVP
jgi:phosphatidylethanolamine-binding protein (PEBP) family uncharacterized protein